MFRRITRVGFGSEFSVQKSDSARDITMWFTLLTLKITPSRLGNRFSSFDFTSILFQRGMVDAQAVLTADGTIGILSTASKLKKQCVLR